SLENCANTNRWMPTKRPWSPTACAAVGSARKQELSVVPRLVRTAAQPDKAPAIANPPMIERTALRRMVPPPVIMPPPGRPRGLQHAQHRHLPDTFVHLGSSGHAARRVPARP